MSAILISFLASLLICLLLIRYQHIHARFSMDTDLLGVQKFHKTPVPRVGGIAIIMGFTFALIPRWGDPFGVDAFAFKLLLASIPVFSIGLLEDITKNVSVRKRLIATAISALICGYLLNTWLTNIELFGLDFFLQFPLIAIIFTCFCVTGVANSFNIIDGYHGLSSFIAMMALTSLAYVAFKVGDIAVLVCAFAAIGAILGFFICNYPRGLIFLGDGGAYLIGFWVAELSLLLVSRNAQVSKWFPLLLCFYPIFETIFTLYRRTIVRKSNPSIPDAAHLHQIVYRRIIKWTSGADAGINQNRRNASTAPYLWLLSSTATIPALLFWSNHIALKLCALGFSTFYLWLYWSIIKFKTPPWLRK
jgi:UDP-N-acetylmuramyl pentapeptide phosphotransferase/UDP-N-acetylglucosamine-1-phosphate transferase